MTHTYLNLIKIITCVTFLQFTSYLIWKSDSGMMKSKQSERNLDIGENHI